MYEKEKGTEKNTQQPKTKLCKFILFLKYRLISMSFLHQEIFVVYICAVEHGAG